MAHRGKIQRTVTVAALLAALSFPPGPDAGNEADGQATRGPECDSAADCASALMALSDEGPSLPAPTGCYGNDFWTTDVAGLYRMTSATVLHPGTEGALRVIEFTSDSAGDDEAP